MASFNEMVNATIESGQAKRNHGFDDLGDCDVMAMVGERNSKNHLVFFHLKI